MQVKGAQEISRYFAGPHCFTFASWGRHQMETISALLAICAGNSPVTGEFPAQRPVTRRFDAFFGLRLNNRLSKQWWGWRFETPSPPLWRHCNDWNGQQTLEPISQCFVRSKLKASENSPLNNHDHPGDQIRSQFPHVTTTKLPWHVQNSDLTWALFFT